MERSVAIKKLGKLLGKKLGYRIDPKAATPEEREAARAELDPAMKERNALRDRRDARSKAILAADPEYQSIVAAHKVAVDKVEKLSWITRRRKITVGTSEGLFFLVKAEGDSWEEVIAKIEAKR